MSSNMFNNIVRMVQGAMQNVVIDDPEKAEDVNVLAPQNTETAPTPLEMLAVPISKQEHKKSDHSKKKAKKDQSYNNSKRTATKFEMDDLIFMEEGRHYYDKSNDLRKEHGNETEDANNEDMCISNIMRNHEYGYHHAIGTPVISRKRRVSFDSDIRITENECDVQNEMHAFLKRELLTNNQLGGNHDEEKEREANRIYNCDIAYTEYTGTLQEAQEQEQETEIEESKEAEEDQGQVEVDQERIQNNSSDEIVMPMPPSLVNEDIIHNGNHQGGVGGNGSFSNNYDGNIEHVYLSPQNEVPLDKTTKKQMQTEFAARYNEAVISKYISQESYSFYQQRATFLKLSMGILSAIITSFATFQTIGNLDPTVTLIVSIIEITISVLLTMLTVSNSQLQYDKKAEQLLRKTNAWGEIANDAYMWFNEINISATINMNGVSSAIHALRQRINKLTNDDVIIPKKVIADYEKLVKEKQKQNKGNHLVMMTTQMDPTSHLIDVSHCEKYSPTFLSGVTQQCTLNERPLLSGTRGLSAGVTPFRVHPLLSSEMFRKMSEHRDDENDGDEKTYKQGIYEKGERIIKSYRGGQNGKEEDLARLLLSHDSQNPNIESLDVMNLSQLQQQQQEKEEVNRNKRSRLEQEQEEEEESLDIMDTKSNEGILVAENAQEQFMRPLKRKS